MGDGGTGQSQAVHGSQSFTRLEPSARNRSSTVQTGLVAENVKKGAEGFLADEATSVQVEGMKQKKASVNGLVTSTRDLSAYTASSGANDEIPIEILSLIDR